MLTPRDRGRLDRDRGASKRAQTHGSKGSAEWRSTVTTLAGVVSVLLVAAGLFYTNAANRKQEDLAVQGQVADRFSAAIDQLGQDGADKLSVRLGGVYGLQRLMRDSPSDQPAIIDVLCAFISDKVPKPLAFTLPEEMPISPADVRAAFKVVAHRPTAPAGVKVTPDLSRALVSLYYDDMRGVSLPGADLSLTSLVGVKFDDADLSGANLSETDLHGASFARARLRGANFGGLGGGADFSAANLRDADLSGADLEGANFTGAQLDGTDFRGSDLLLSHGLTTQQVARSKVDYTTRMPPNVEAPPVS